MAQHKQSRRRVMRSALKHKSAADQFLDVLEEMTANIATARAKIAADTTGTWDVDYVATSGVTSVDFDAKSYGQHKASFRKMMIDKMAHKRLGDDVTDLLEESQVSLNLVLAQMDADGGTLSGDPTYEAFRISDPIDADARSYGQHKQSFRKVMRAALSHRTFGDSMSDELAAVQSEINAMIDDIQAAN